MALDELLQELKRASDASPGDASAFAAYACEFERSGGSLGHLVKGRLKALADQIKELLLRKIGKEICPLVEFSSTLYFNDRVSRAALYVADLPPRSRDIPVPPEYAVDQKLYLFDRAGLFTVPYVLHPQNSDMLGSFGHREERWEYYLSHGLMALKAIERLANRVKE